MKQRIQVSRILAAAAVLGFGVLMALQVQARNATPEQIAERLKPSGELCLQGMDCGGVAAAPVAAGPKSGDQVYNSVCMACHNTGAAGAPKKGDVAAWSTRLAQGVDTLYDHSLNGIRGMPAKGGNPNLSDAEVKAAVDYLIEASR
ncbi:c-type cytochrome [Marinospirillum sp.]|uniref:c-type cytochrome n=1 Tax=Marinospirillum sp. TaxID=2183934 RepID=UPI0025BEDC39|nr:c-type cytochrome [Marinospirillum sp.]